MSSPSKYENIDKIKKKIDEGKKRNKILNIETLRLNNIPKKICEGWILVKDNGIYGKKKNVQILLKYLYLNKNGNKSTNMTNCIRSLVNEFPDEILIPILKGIEPEDLPTVLSVCKDFYRLRDEYKQNVICKTLGYNLTDHLMVTVNNSDNDYLRQLLKQGADVNERDIKTEDTALIRASSKGHNDTAGFLIKAGADVNKKGEEATALIYASLEGHTDIVRLLIDAGADLNTEARHGITPLMIASKKGYTDMVRLLIEAGAEVNKETQSFKYQNIATALISASKAGNKDIVRLLIEAGGDVNKEAKFGNTALISACIEGHTDIVILLIEAGVETDKQNKYGNSALHQALRHEYKHEDIVLLLIENVDKDILQLLFEEGVDTDKEKKYGNSALIYEYVKGQKEIVKWLDIYLSRALHN